MDRRAGCANLISTLLRASLRIVRHAELYGDSSYSPPQGPQQPWISPSFSPFSFALFCTVQIGRIHEQRRAELASRRLKSPICSFGVGMSGSRTCFPCISNTASAPPARLLHSQPKDPPHNRRYMRHMSTSVHDCANHPVFLRSAPRRSDPSAPIFRPSRLKRSIFSECPMYTHLFSRRTIGSTRHLRRKCSSSAEIPSNQPRWNPQRGADR